MSNSPELLILTTGGCCIIINSKYYKWSCLENSKFFHANQNSVYTMGVY